jgi:hypothetical protein
MSKNKNQPKAQPAAATSSAPLKFAVSTFGAKKAEPSTPERLQAVRELHGTMCDKAEDGSDILPSKTDFVVAASKAGFTTREIADALGMKPAVVYSMIWRKTSGYKPKRKPAAEGGAEASTEGGNSEDEVGEDLTDEEAAELEESELEDGVEAEV